jgi:hypothetical protein
LASQLEGRNEAPSEDLQTQSSGGGLAFIWAAVTPPPGSCLPTSLKVDIEKDCQSFVSSFAREIPTAGSTVSALPLVG